MPTPRLRTCLLAGALLLAVAPLEAGIRVELDGVVKAVHVRPGDVVAARDLLIEFE